MLNWFNGKIRPRLKVLTLVGGFTVVVCGSLPVFATEDSKKNTLVVGDDKKQCPMAQFMEIEDAVIAAPSGATIHVCPGTYKKQVIITKPLTITADTGSILQPTGAIPNTFNADDNTSITALLLVIGARGVSINDLTVDGSGSSATINSCGPDYVGVMYKNSSGQLTNMAVRNIKLGAGLEGCQSGEGIFVQNDSGNLDVDISDSSVHDYQKTGILIDRQGSDSNVKHNYVTGLGSTQHIAQNGIQISRGASATVANNFVNNHLYALCTPTSCSAASTNILIINAANDVAVRNNTAGTAQIGIAVMSDSTQVLNNDVYDNKVFDGIDLLGNNNRASSNNIFHSDTSGVFIAGNNNRVDGNTINEAPDGVLIFGSGNQVSGNTYFNVPVPVSVNPPMMTAAPVNSTGPRAVSPR
jgi:parallel beta-helix repeat protein